MFVLLVVCAYARVHVLWCKHSRGGYGCNATTPQRFCRGLVVICLLWEMSV